MLLKIYLYHTYHHHNFASQFWHAEKLSHSFSNKLSISIEDEFRSEGFGKNNYYFHGDIGLKFESSFNGFSSIDPNISELDV